MGHPNANGLAASTQVSCYVFIGVRDYVLDALSARDWAKVYEIYEAGSISQLEGLKTLVVSDTALEYDPNHEALYATAKRVFDAGKRVVVLAAEGLFAGPGTVSAAFGCKWRFHSYTKDTFVLTSVGAKHLGGSPGDLATDYMKGNFLNAPNGEQLMIPKPSTFEEYYGCSMDDADDDDIESFRERQQNPDKETPAALHVGVDGGELVWLGFINYGYDKHSALIAQHIIQHKTCFVRPEAAKSHSQTLKLFHGTSWANAQKIMREGFIKSEDGCLGPGVYVAHKEKATKFASDPRHGGAEGGLVHVLVSFGNPKFVCNDDRSWQQEGFDACRADHTSFSSNMEWCMAETSQVQIISVQQIALEDGAAGEVLEPQLEPTMPFWVCGNVFDNDAEEDMFGNMVHIIDGRISDQSYTTAAECNAAAGAALFTWLGENCSEWSVDGVNCAMFQFEGQEHLAMVQYNDTATLRNGQRIELTAQFFSRES